MGHTRLGRLPKYLKWRAVVSLLQSEEIDPQEVAARTVEAAESYLRTLARDPSLTYSFWLLTRILWASRSPNFTSQLAELGITADPNQSAVDFIADLTDHIRARLSTHPESGPISELVTLAFQRALGETVGTQPRSLFGSTVEDMQSAFRAFSTERQFSEVSRRFFADFMSRLLRSYVEREVSNQIGSGAALQTVQDSAEFSRALDLHTRQSAAIMREFAGGWYSKNNWQSRGSISQDEAQGFVAVALRKLRSDLKLDG